MLIEQIFHIIRSLLIRTRNLRCLLSLTVECCLIDLESTFHDNSICRNLVARLKIHEISNHNLTHMNLEKFSVSNDFCDLLCLFLFLEGRRLVFLFVLTDRCNSICNHNRNQNSYRLKPFRLSEQKKSDLNNQCDQQNHNHRILETFKNLFPQRVRRNLRQIIRAMLFATLFYLF